MTDKRRGRQDPTKGFTLPYQKTRGPEAVAYYNATGRTAQEWQENLLYDILAVKDDGMWVHSRFGYSVPRQNGKNEVVAIREMFGLFNGERILHTAHRTATSGAAWARLCDLLEKYGIHERNANNRDGYRSGKSKGQEFIELPEAEGGGRINFRTRTTTGGLGETYDLLIIDEAQEFQDDQESTLKPTIVTSEHPQIIYLGTPPTPYSSGTIFPKLRQQILCGEKSHAGWAEWSVEEETDPHNVDAWYDTNPSLGYKITEEAIEDEIGEDTIDFNIQRLGLWIKYNQKSAISKKEWLSLEVQTLPKLTGYLSVGIKFNRDGSSAAMAIAGRTEDGLIFTEVIGRHILRDGIDWMLSFLVALNGNYSQVVADGINGIEVLTNGMKDAGLKKPYQITTGEYKQANVRFEQNLFAKKVIHMSQPSVENVVTNCEKRAIGSDGAFRYESIVVENDISIMDAMILAAWAVDEFSKPKKVQKISY